MSHMREAVMRPVLAQTHSALFCSQSTIRTEHPLSLVFCSYVPSFCLLVADLLRFLAGSPKIPLKGDQICSLFDPGEAFGHSLRWYFRLLLFVGRSTVIVHARRRQTHRGQQRVPLQVGHS